MWDHLLDLESSPAAAYRPGLQAIKTKHEEEECFAVVEMRWTAFHGWLELLRYHRYKLNLTAQGGGALFYKL